MRWKLFDMIAFDYTQCTHRYTHTLHTTYVFADKMCVHFVWIIPFVIRRIHKRRYVCGPSFYFRKDGTNSVRNSSFTASAHHSHYHICIYRISKSALTDQRAPHYLMEMYFKWNSIHSCCVCGCMRQTQRNYPPQNNISIIQHVFVQNEVDGISGFYTSFNTINMSFRLLSWLYIAENEKKSSFSSLSALLCV